MSVAAPALVRPVSPFGVEIGRVFVSPAFDYLLIGGGLSLLLAMTLAMGGQRYVGPLIQSHEALIILLCNSAHFAASTVRLYTKSGTRRDLPFLTMGLPLATVLVLTVAIAYPAELGRHLWPLYVTWSPYHYSAQAYGLAIMYCYRSGGTWSSADKRWLRMACLCPFLYVFFGGKGVGVDWLVPASIFSHPVLHLARTGLGRFLAAGSFVLPLLILARHQRAGRSRLPIISMLIMLSNGVWLIWLAYKQAFVWATIFHGLQYLAIVSIFHVKEKTREGGGGRPGWPHAVRFYAACLGLGYLLFQVWPHGYALLGFGFTESVILVVTAVNLHHFIVDAFIWRLRRDPNYAIVQLTATQA
jgi:hypothetical protein